MRVRKHYSDATRNLIQAHRLLVESCSLLQEARRHLRLSHGGEVPDCVDAGTFSAFHALSCGRDNNGEAEPDSKKSVMGLLVGLIDASIEQDDADKADL